MAIYTKESLENLKQRVDLVDLLSSHIEFKKSGAAYKACCPFHDEKTPSFMIQKGDQHYHCYGCGAHGDAIQFLMSHLKMHFSEAVETLAARYHVHLEQIDQHETKGPNKSLLKEALEHACRFYHFYLLHTPEGHQVLDYLYKRGIDLDFIRLFQVGLAPAKPGMMRKILHSKYVKDQTMVEAGLLSETSSGGYREFFLERITFPIRDHVGAVIGFSARKYRQETFGGKYINTSETALFKKSRILFGLNYSRKRIAKERQAIIVEGQIDALRLIQAGFNMTVAGQGTAFGESHAKELIALGINRIYLALDGDEAGRAAAVKIGNLFQKEGVEVRLIQLPDGLDPDAFIREEGPDKFQELMEKSIDYLTFLVSQSSRQININSPAGKNQLIQEIIKQIREWNHQVMVHESLKKLAQLTQTPEELVGVGQTPVPNRYIKQYAAAGVQEVNPDKILELDLLRWLVLMGNTHPHFVELVRMNIKPEQFREKACKELFEAAMQCYALQEKVDFFALAIGGASSEGQTVLTELLSKKINKDKAEQQLEEAIKSMLNRSWMEQREQIKQKIHSGQCSDEEALALAKEFERVKNDPPQILKINR